MNRGLIIDYNSVAAYLAHADVNIQADFFTTFSKELNKCCQTNYHAQMQLAAINEKLSNEVKVDLAMLTYKETK
jgi:hypothetical protein